MNRKLILIIDSRLQESKIKQRIQEEAKTVDVIERMKLIEVADHEVNRRHCELDSKVKKPAEAEKIRLEVISQATHQKTLLEAAASADSIAMKGDADAFALEARAKAEAEVMQIKGDAWREYHKAAKVSTSTATNLTLLLSRNLSPRLLCFWKPFLPLLPKWQLQCHKSIG